MAQTRRHKVAHNVFDPHGRLAKLARGKVGNDRDGAEEEEDDDDKSSIDSVQRHCQDDSCESQANCEVEIFESLYPNKDDDAEKPTQIGYESLNLNTIAESNENGNGHSATEDTETDRERMKRATLLTTLLLDMKTNMKADHNIVDPSESILNDQRNNRENATQSVVVSRSTFLRAEKVKSMIAIKYLYLQRTLDWANANEDINLHCHVEGVYNPLQVIRNRRVRAKYKEYLRPLSFKELPLASNVFSKHSIKDSNYAMLWSIDLTELIGDPIWRTYHWNELRNPHGKLWFPPEKSNSNAAVDGGRIKLHDKLFGLEDENAQQNNLSQPSSSLSVDELIKPTRSKSTSPVRERLRDKINKKMWIGSSHDSTSDIERVEEMNDEEANVNDHDHNDDEETEGLKGALNDKISPRKESSNAEPAALKVPPVVVINYELPVAQTVDSSRSNSSLDIHGIYFKPVEKDKENEVEKSKDDNEDSLKATSSEDDNKDLDDDETHNLPVAIPIEKSISGILLEPKKIQDLEEIAQIRSIMENLALIRKVANIRLHYYYAVYPHLANSVITRISKIINNEMSIVHEKSNKIATQDLPAQERMYMTFLAQIQDMLHMINDKYSIRVDSLLSSSDRSIGELNTSVSLEMRKVNERLDKLHNQLMGRSIRDSFGVETLKGNYGESGGYQINLGIG
ncbi:uncharacterized protein KQ657_003339 [Scheffersomyces spartinae]|uniref:Uncharacterized protein n=1 Tax=Scheffersomyces spartinae TaxID=45513 RepID=A0A9P8AK66_9ASCO|nr:uncharacterized protein KQ657_003339 [Scheffersomyces spartinae]KAG7195572.1 hypothetical protein KQ657_003339 [Scheffersomyces spartinae]